MANDTVLTIVGNLTSEAELRFSASGTAVATFSVASTPRSYDRQSGSWKDGNTLFLRCTVWRQAAENLAESGLPKGTRVIVQGRLNQRSFETREGEKRTVYELEVDEVGPSLAWATAQVTRVQGGSRPRGGAQEAAPVDDPWGSAAAPQDDSGAPF